MIPIPESEKTDILIVEDSPTQAEQLRYILERHGFRVRLARDGVKALAEMRASKPTLVISDITMPEMDGYQLCHALRSDPLLEDLPVILLTSLTNPDDVFKGLQCGADNFITKPYETNYLLTRVRHLLANAHLRSRHEVQMNMQVFFAGQKHIITADRAQILNLLLSTYEAAVQRNRELEQARDELRVLNEQLEARVEERTASLQTEIAVRLRAEEKVLELNASLERRVAERTAELQAVNAELESFSYSISHDLRSPLRAIQGYSAIALKDYGPQLPPEGSGLLERVVASTERMGHLVDDLLRFSQLSRQSLTKKPIQLTPLVEDIVREVRLATGNKTTEVRQAPLPDGEGDSSLLRQVFINLISNAFKFSRKHEHPVVEIGTRQKDGEIIYFVRDNGAGFDMRYAEKLFGVFQRLHGVSEFEGTGIGLSIVQRIINRHGGRIWAEAAVGQGATFFFTLAPAT